jgi:hypothetical protein
VVKESHRDRVPVNFSGGVCVLEADDDDVSEVLGGGGRADGDQIDEAMKME